MKLWLWRHRIACTFVIFLLFRLVFLFRYPVFNDEAIYVRYGQLMIENPTLRWASIHFFSKQPLAFWIFGLGAKLFGGPFTGARLVTLLINSMSFFFLWSWLKRISDEKVTVTTLILFAVCPVFVFFQTLALMEGFLVTAVITILWALERYNGTHNFRYVLVLTGILAFSLWIKSNALLLTVVTISYLIYSNRTLSGRVRWHIFALSGLLLTFMAPLLIRPDFTRILSGPDEYTFTIRELLSFPFVAWWRNISLVILAFFLYLTPIYLPALFFGGDRIHKRFRIEIYIFAISIIGVSVLLGKAFTIRYTLMGVIPLLPLIAAGLISVPKVRFFSLSLGLGIPFICSILLVIYSPWFFGLFPKGTVLSYERGYGYEYTSGYAIARAISYVQTHLAVHPPVILAVADTPGNPSDAIMATFYQSPEIATIILNSPADLKQYASMIIKYPTYVIARNDTMLPFLLPYLSTVVTFPTPGNTDIVGIYKINIH